MAFTEPTETLVNYPLNGSNRRFNIPFDYLQRSFIRVSLFAANKEEQLTLGVDFNFVNDTTIETVKAYGGAEGWTRIQLRRYTDAKRIVEFIDGSVLQAGDLNVATLQALHIAQEGRDSAFDMLTVNSGGSYDAKDRRITNMAKGVTENDAATVGQFTDWTNLVASEANRAKKEADRAEAAGNAAITPLKRYVLRIRAQDIVDNIIQLPTIPIDVTLYLNGKIPLFTSNGDYSIVGSKLILKGTVMPWDYFNISINKEVLVK